MNDLLLTLSTTAAAAAGLLTGAMVALDLWHRRRRASSAGLAPLRRPPTRPLQPVYFVLDTSQSMAGDGIEALNELLSDALPQLASAPDQGADVAVSVITFADRAEVSLPLRPLSHTMPLHHLRAYGATSFGPVLVLLRRSIAEDLAALRAVGRDRLPPIVYFLMDGRPTDGDWESALAALTANASRLRPRLIAFGVGDADTETLAKVGDAGAFLSDDRARPSDAIHAAGNAMVASLIRSRENLSVVAPEGFSVIKQHDEDS